MQAFEVAAESTIRPWQFPFGQFLRIQVVSEDLQVVEKHDLIRLALQKSRVPPLYPLSFHEFL
jgi:hypothetical protein